MELIDRAFCQKGRVATLGRRLLGEVVADCDASEATFWAISADGMYLEGALNCGKTPHVIENINVPVDDSVVGMVAQSGTPINIGPEAHYNPKVDTAAGTRTNAMIVAPVQVAMERCGVLSAIKTAEKGLFPEDATERLQWKAYILGLILSDSLHPGPAGGREAAMGPGHRG